MLLSRCPHWRNNFTIQSYLNSHHSDIPFKIYNLTWNIIPQNLISRVRQTFISADSWALSRIRIDSPAFSQWDGQNFPRCVVTFYLIQSSSRSAKGIPTESFPSVTSEGCVWNACSWLVLERGVTLLLFYGLTDWQRCVVLAPALCEFPDKLEQLPCQLRLLCRCVCGVWCGDESLFCTKVQKRQYHESTCRWHLALPWWPYTLQSNFRLFSELLRLFTGRGVSFMATVLFPYRIHNASRT